MKLYACPGTCSLAPHILLHEFEVPHEIVWLDLKKGETLTPEFRAVNPVAQVPTLVTDEGEVITEVAAISVYLFETYGNLDTPIHQIVRQLSFIATELHRSFYAIFFAKIIMGEEQAPVLAEHFRKRLGHRWKYINNLLPADDDLDGAELGPADPYLYTTCRWWKAIGENFEAYPNIEAFLVHMEARACVQAALKVEKLEPVAATPAKTE